MHRKCFVQLPDHLINDLPGDGHSDIHSVTTYKSVGNYCEVWCTYKIQKENNLSGIITILLLYDQS